MKFNWPWFSSWFGSTALSERPGRQITSPPSALVPGIPSFPPDSALQIATVWACVHRRATTIASLPLFYYENLSSGMRELARLTPAYIMFHNSPNRRMTSMEFWRAMVMNHDLRGNAYARLSRDERTGEVREMWPLPSDQVEMQVIDGEDVYLYRYDNNVVALAAENVLHIKDMGNGTVGLSRIDYMNSTTNEAQTAQAQASKVFGTSGKPTGVLMIDKTLKKEQREELQKRFQEMQTGDLSRLYVLEAGMKYQQLSLSPEDQQLLESRKFQIEEICRWYDVPPVLIHHSNVTTWGSGIEQIVDGFHKLSIRPMLVSIEQALTKRVLTPAQRARYTVEFSFDALLRASLKDRMEIYSKAVQNGIKNRNECRQLENDPPYAGGEVFTAQTNLAPVDKLGTINLGKQNASTQDPFAQ